MRIHLSGESDCMLMSISSPETYFYLYIYFLFKVHHWQHAQKVALRGRSPAWQGGMSWSCSQNQALEICVAMPPANGNRCCHFCGKGVNAASAKGQLNFVSRKVEPLYLCYLMNS